MTDDRKALDQSKHKSSANCHANSQSAGQPHQPAFDVRQSISDQQTYLTSLAATLMGRYLKTRADVADLVQQTLLSGIRDQGKFRGRTTAELREWLSQILQHQIVDEYRRQMMQQRASGIVRMLQMLRQSQQHLEDEEQAERHELVERLRTAMSRLPVEQQQIVQMHYLEQMSFQQIAEKTQRSHDAVRRSCLKGMKSLTDLFRTESEQK
ncbi:MAG: hypothetical protein Fues2KO_24030 [Fuerstiella sp.]